MKSRRFFGSQIWVLGAFLQLGAISLVSAQVADPILSPSAGTGSSTVTVNITDSTPSSILYYTTNGTAPTTSSSVVPATGALLINTGTVLKVQAYQGNTTPSNVIMAQYTANGFVSSGPQHAVVLKNDGTVWGSGANASGQLGNGGVATATLPMQASVSGANPIASTISRNMATENGLPIYWELLNFGQTDLNPNALAPNSSGLTILQCYQQGVRACSH